MANLITRLFTGLKAMEERDMSWWTMGFDAPPGSTIVTPQSALGLSACYASVSLLADTISTLPVDAFLRTEDGRIPSPERPLWIDYPGGAWSGSIETLNQVMTSLTMRGNAYVLTPRSQGLVTGLVVLDPDQCLPNDRGGYTLAGEELGPSEVMHIRGMMLPGTSVGVSVIKAAKASFAHGLSVQEFGRVFFENGAWPGALIETEKKLTDQGQRNLKASFDALHKGPANAHKVAILTEGAKLSRISFSAEDSQFIETMKFKVGDVARLFRVPPHLIGDASGSTSWGSGLAEQGVAFAKHSLRPWVERIEQAYTRLWMSEGGPSNGFVKLNMSAVLRGSDKERAEFYSSAIAAGWMDEEEVRALEDLPPRKPAKTNNSNEDNNDGN